MKVKIIPVGVFGESELGERRLLVITEATEGQQESGKPPFPAKIIQ